MNKMVGLDAYECKGCGHTMALGNGDQGSIKAQLDLCRKYCRKKDYTIGGEFYDEALSGANLNRPGLDAAIGTLKRGDVLVIYMMDRLSRGECIQWADIELRIQDKKARYESASDEGTWGNSPQDRLNRTVNRALACYNREIGNLRTSESMIAHQSSGRRMTPLDRVPFGMMADPNDAKKLIDSPAEQETIKTIVSVYGEVLLGKHRGQGYRETTRRAREMGITNRNGNPIAHTLVIDMIKKHAAV